MDLEYLVVGIAKEQQEDYREFYDRTKIEVYMFAMSIVKDRVLAREIAVEAYRRIYSLAYKFDTDLNAEYWLLDIVKNISLNALRDEKLEKISENRRIDNLSGLLCKAIIDSKEERGQILILRTVSGLSKAEIARLLWYQQGSASAEYNRAVKELVGLSYRESSKKDVLKAIDEDAKACVPDMWGLVVGNEDTKVSYISHEEISISDDELAFSEEQEELTRVKRASDVKRRKKKLYTIIVAVILSICIIAAVIVGVYAYQKSKSKTEDEDSEITTTLPQYDTKMSMYEKNGVLYFQDYSNGGVITKAEFSNGEVVLTKLSDAVPKEIINGEECIVYRNNEDGKMYCLDTDDLTSSKLSEISGAAIAFHDGFLYFSSNTGISRIDLTSDEKAVEDIFTVNSSDSLYRYNIEISEDEDVYFSSGVGAGLYRLEEYEGEMLNQEICSYNVYDFEIYGDYLFFDSSEYEATVLYRINLVNNNIDVMNKVHLSSAAVCIDDGYIYYEGYSEVDDEGNGTNHGIYCVSVEGGTPELVIPASESSIALSDMYISDNRIYCYYCTGEQDGAKTFVAYDRNGIDAENCDSKKTVIFEVK